MKLTFVDAGVLIAAARGGSEQASRAMEILDDPEREFAASPFLRLEVLPQAVFNKREAEMAFYEAFFSAVSKWATDLEAITEAALREASTYGVEAMDALHVAAAASVGAAELVTTEKPLLEPLLHLLRRDDPSGLSILEPALDLLEHVQVVLDVL